MAARLNSTAVMARRVEPADSLDFFPTPPWATRAFCEIVLPQIWIWPDVYKGVALDPACGEGHMAVALGEYFDDVAASDIHPYGFGEVADFLHDDFRPVADWIITNPPFNAGPDFVLKALQLARRGVAMLVRTQFQEGAERYHEIYARRPPQAIAQSVERIPMHRGRWVINGKTATAYEWFVWLKHPPHDWLHTRFLWIPPGQRRGLTRHDDWLRFSGCMDIPATHAVLTGLWNCAKPPAPLLEVAG